MRFSATKFTEWARSRRQRDVARETIETNHRAAIFVQTQTNSTAAPVSAQ